MQVSNNSNIDNPRNHKNATRPRQPMSSDAPRKATQGRAPNQAAKHGAVVFEANVSIKPIPKTAPTSTPDELSAKPPKKPDRWLLSWPRQNLAVLANSLGGLALSIVFGVQMAKVYGVVVAAIVTPLLALSLGYAAYASFKVITAKVITAVHADVKKKRIAADPSGLNAKDLRANIQQVLSELIIQ